jgi:hypothetical protein
MVTSVAYAEISFGVTRPVRAVQVVGYVVESARLPGAISMQATRVGDVCNLEVWLRVQVLGWNLLLHWNDFERCSRGTVQWIGYTSTGSRLNLAPPLVANGPDGWCGDEVETEPRVASRSGHPALTASLL